MEHYYETSERGTITAHGTLELAIEYADKHGCALISEIGGNWDDYEKCTFCNEWCISTELSKDGECEYCEQAIKSHGGI